MFGWVKKLGRKASSVESGLKGWFTKRWDAAATNRLNRAQWGDATGTSINQRLLYDLETLRNRASDELKRNPVAEGVVNTTALDMIGPSGPTLQVVGDDTAYNDALEFWWKAWWKCPDHNGELSGAEILESGLNVLWTCGELLWQITTAGDDDALDVMWPDGEFRAMPIKARLMSIHPSRLQTPISMAGDANVILGIRVTDTGRKLTYYIADNPDFNANAGVDDVRPIDAENIIHWFRVKEPEQVRGIPWFATPLQSMADTRDYDKFVLLAAQNAASQGVVLATDHADSHFKELEKSESVEIEPNVMTTAPPGWKPYLINPAQPSAQHNDYLNERHRRIGLPIGMPLMIIHHDSSGHNYSSARFDGQTYLRMLKAIRGRLAVRVMDRLVWMIAREGELEGVIPRRTGPVRLQWTWPVPPHVDPKKEADAEATRLRSGTESLTGAAAAHGKDVETLIAERKRDNELLTDAGLPTVEESLNPTPGGGTDTKAGDAEDTEDSPPAKRNGRMFPLGTM